MQKNQRGRKFTGIFVPSFNIYPKPLVVPDRFDNKSIFIHPSKPPDNLICHCQWDNLSKDIWKKFIANQQTDITYRKKIMLWKYLLIYLKVNIIFENNTSQEEYSLYFFFSYNCSRYIQNMDCILLVPL